MLRNAVILSVAGVVAMALVIGMAGNASAQSVLWLKADTLGLSDGETVNSWADSSPAGIHDATRVAGTPTYVADGVNGQPVVRFEDTDPDHLAIPDHPSLDLNHYTVFAVAMQTEAGEDVLIIKGGQVPREGGGTDPSWNYLVLPYGTGIQAGPANRTGVPSGDIYTQSNTHILNEFGILTNWFDISGHPEPTDTIRFYRDGARDEKQSVIAGKDDDPPHLLDFTNDEPVYIGGGGSPLFPLYFTGDLAELAILPFAATEQQILDVNAYLGAKYGIDVAPNGNAAAGEALLAVPEPSSLMLVGLGLLSLALWRWRRRR